MKINKVADENGLVVEFFKDAPDKYLRSNVRLFNNAFMHGGVPSSWRRTIVSILAKRSKARMAADIANIRLMYKIFACMLLGRMEANLEAAQPEEQHGFRHGRRIDEHLLPANIVIDKRLSNGRPIWIISVSVSKAFDWVSWFSLWEALSPNCVCGHLTRILQQLYAGQNGGCQRPR